MQFCYANESLSLTEISRRTGVKLGTLRRRVLKLGLSLEAALAQPVRGLNFSDKITGTKRCAACGGVFALSLFKKHSRGKQRYSGYCRACDNVRNKAHAQGQRLTLLRHYGGAVPVCAECGEARVAVLDIHHIEGRGTTHRKQLGHNRLVYRELIQSGFPTGYGVLCRNCNWIEHLKRNKCGAYKEL